MRAVIQRVRQTTLSVDGRRISEIRGGLAVYLGIAPEDSEKNAQAMAKKVAQLRIFEDEQGKMNRSVLDVGGEVLLISQFTLFGDCTHGNRPSFIKAGEPGMADALYERFMKRCRTHVAQVEKGRFGADMKVELLNDGPFTLMLDSGELF